MEIENSVIVIVYTTVILLIFSIYVFLKSCSGISRNQLLDPISTFHVYSNVKVLILFEVDGNLDAVSFRSRLVEKTINAKNPTTGSFLYPQFKEFIRSKYGFCFWEKDMNFSIDNHFQTNETAPVYMFKERSELEKCLMNIAHTTKFDHSVYSPWKMVLIKYKMEPEHTIKTGIVLLFEHCLGDGLSVYKALIRSADSYVEPLKPQILIGTENTKLVSSNSTIKIKPDSNFKWSRENSTEAGNIIFASSTKPIDIQKIKTIKREQGISFTSICFCALGAGMQHLLKENTPATVSSSIGFPRSFNNDSLSNNMNMLPLLMPMSEKDNTIRAAECQRYLESSIKTMNTFMFKLAFSIIMAYMRFPAWLQFFQLSKFSPPPVLCTNFPGPTQEVAVLGKRITDIMHVGLVPQEALGFHICSYGDQIRFILSGDKRIFPDELSIRNTIQKIDQCVEDLYNKQKSKKSTGG